MRQVTLEYQTQSKMKFIKAAKRRNTDVFQVLATQRNFIFDKYQVQELIGSSIKIYHSKAEEESVLSHSDDDNAAMENFYQ